MIQFKRIHASLLLRSRLPLEGLKAYLLLIINVEPLNSLVIIPGRSLHKRET